MPLSGERVGRIFFAESLIIERLLSPKINQLISFVCDALA